MKALAAISAFQVLKKQMLEIKSMNLLERKSSSLQLLENKKSRYSLIVFLQQLLVHKQ